MKSSDLKTVIFLVELLRRKKELFYFQEKHECDFVVKQGRAMREAIQVCYEINDDNQAREFDGLLEAMQACRLSEGILLTYDQEDEKVINGKKYGFYLNFAHIKAKPRFSYSS
jgi:predicted AAA+ superfamily ATPase